MANGVNVIERNKQMAREYHPDKKQEHMTHKRVGLFLFPGDPYASAQAKSEQTARCVLEKKQTIDSEKKEKFTLKILRTDFQLAIRSLSLEREKQASIIENKQKGLLKLLLMHNLCAGMKKHLEVVSSCEFGRNEHVFFRTINTIRKEWDKLCF